ncbi:MAG: ubiquinone/menaquinone biosynthesis methyltransferase [Chthoniobacterales bacterium]
MSSSAKRSIHGKVAHTSTQTPEPATRDPQRVREMFGRIASRYDLANHLLSAGADILWRRRAARIVARWQPRRVLDLATGSGDLALALQRRLPATEVHAADFSEEMIAIARRKGVQHAIVADALHLPYDTAGFDAVAIAFGLRNMADWGAALREMRRMLRLGGQVLVLDFSLPCGALQPFYRFYLHRVLPRAAALITGAGDAYSYLAGSIEVFPSGEEMLKLIEQNGFADAQAQRLSGGIATIYTAHAVAP